LLATAAAGILLQSGVLVFSGFVAYNSRFGNRVGGPPSPYAYPVLLAGTITLAIGMWLSAIVIGESTEEFEWEVKSEPDDDLDKPEKGTSTSNPGTVAETAFRVFWLQKGISDNDQSFDSFMLMAKGEKKTILTSCRNNDPNSHEEAQNTGKKDESTDVSVSLNILCMISTFASITGFILQFEGFRGISWACSIAQLVAILIMTILRAIIRRGMLDSPATEKITPEYEIEWLSHKLGFDSGYLMYLSDPPKKPCFTWGLGWCNPFQKITPPLKCNPPADSVTTCWKICNKLNYPTNAELSIKSVKLAEGKAGPSVTVGKSRLDSTRRPGYSPSSATLVSRDQLSIGEKEHAVKEQEKRNSQQVHAVVNIRKRLAKLTEWKAPPSGYAACIAKAICKVMDLFDFEKMDTFIWSMDVQIYRDEKSKQPGKLKLVANKGSQSEPSWTTSEEDIEAILSLWMYHFQDQSHRNIQVQRTRSHLEKPEPIGMPFRRVLGPNTSVLKTDLAWWAGEGVEEALDQFKWEDYDSLSLGYGYPSKYFV
jgi:hypothetical protein